jgi:hypothetical protein
LSNDGARIYGVRVAGNQELVRIDAATGRTEVLNILSEPLDIRGPLGEPARLAISPDEKSAIVTVRRNEGDIWILEGFEAPRGFWKRLW